MIVRNEESRTGLISKDRLEVETFQGYSLGTSIFDGFGTLPDVEESLVQRARSGSKAITICDLWTAYRQSAKDMGGLGTCWAIKKKCELTLVVEF
jgi:hypothetical protein